MRINAKAACQRGLSGSCRLDPCLRILTFVPRLGIVGLAAAFIAVMVRPELIARRRPRRSRRAQPAPAPSRRRRPYQPRRRNPAAANSYAEAVERAAPGGGQHLYGRLVTERIQPNAIEELFGDARPRYRQRLEQSLGSGVIVDEPRT
jgi:S1-C subfamily serine protease